MSEKEIIRGAINMLPDPRTSPLIEIRIPIFKEIQINIGPITLYFPGLDIVVFKKIKLQSGNPCWRFEKII